MSELILVRHTCVAVSGVCYGRSEVPLADSFVTEAAQIKNQLVNLDVSAYYSSPALRCMDLARHLSANIQIDERLTELSFGSWEGKRWDDIGEIAVGAWAQDFVNFAPPQGESYAHLAQRVNAFIKHIPAHTCIVAITHAGVIRATHALLNNIPLADSFAFQPELGGVYRYRV